jgi:hypothetical protein
VKSRVRRFKSFTPHHFSSLFYAGVLRDPILHLRAQGKSYRAIASELGCAKSVVSYHCSPGQKEKLNRRAAVYRVSNLRTILTRKILEFSCVKGAKRRKQHVKPLFTHKDVLLLFSHAPVCYLSGEVIDLMKPSTYCFDHKLARSRGGSPTLTNLGLCTRRANSAKSDMTPEEFYAFCDRVIAFKNGA